MMERMLRATVTSLLRAIRAAEDLFSSSPIDTAEKIRNIECLKGCHIFMSVPVKHSDAAHAHRHQAASPTSIY